MFTPLILPAQDHRRQRPMRGNVARDFKGNFYALWTTHALWSTETYALPLRFNLLWQQKILKQARLQRLTSCCQSFYTFDAERERTTCHRCGQEVHDFHNLYHARRRFVSPLVELLPPQQDFASAFIEYHKLALNPLDSLVWLNDLQFYSKALLETFTEVMGKEHFPIDTIETTKLMTALWEATVKNFKESA